MGATGARVFLLIVFLAAAVSLIAPPPARAADPAPPWNLIDVDGNNVSSETLRGQIVVVEFSGTWCVPCKIVEAAFKDLYPTYSTQGVVFLGVFMPPTNTEPDVEQYRDERAIPWPVAPDSDTVAVRYGVDKIPRILIVDQAGYVVFDWQAYVGFTECDVYSTFRTQIDRTIQGNTTPLTVEAISIPALLVVAALLSFFSPCSFPVLPAFMAYYLNLDAKGPTAGGTKPSTKVAAGRGFVASLGIVLVYGMIAAVVFALGLAAQSIVTYLPPIIGVVLIALAILTLLPYQYHFLTRPFIALKQKLAARFGGKWTPGVRTKLFAFGMGYGAAGFACVAPPFIGAVLNAAALGTPGDAILGLVLYVAIVIGLMVTVTVSLHVAGDRALNKVKAWSGAMKYVSAAALMIAGAYLLWLFLSTSVFNAQCG